MALSKVNGLALAGNQAARTIAPSVTGSLYALGVDKGWMGGQLGWYFLSSVAAVYCLSMVWYPKPVRVDQTRQQDISKV
jgi:hypothetical protein